MKIEVLGNSFTWYPLNDTQFLINDEILVETPQGSSKHLLKHTDFSKIKYIIITHFHSDHFGELHLMFDWFKFIKPAHKVTVIAPKTIKRRFHKLVRLLDAPYSMQKICTYFNFVEMKSGQSVTLGKYTITAFKTEHIVKYSLGYTIQEGDGKVVGITGDTKVCKNLRNIIEKSDMIFMNAAAVVPHRSHMTVQEALDLEEQYPDKDFRVVHVSPQVIEEYGERLHIPNLWEIIEI